MVEVIARFYVNIIEPGLIVLAVLGAVLLVLYVFAMLRGGDKKDSFAVNVVNGLAKVLYKTTVLIGVASLKVVKLTLITGRVIFATIRDFLKSEI